jgi:hypothetical protein
VDQLQPTAEGQAPVLTIGHDDPRDAVVVDAMDLNCETHRQPP